ncbi:transposase [Streptomyces adelaidensis]|uniref:transposase n=1 Tax=Streptomyces adelaidensis TaxID=2796465 RepID=UPI003558D571
MTAAVGADLSKRLVPDELCDPAAPLLPPFAARPQGGGTAPRDERAVFTAVAHALTSACAWRHLPPTFAPRASRSPSPCPARTCTAASPSSRSSGHTRRPAPPKTTAAPPRQTPRGQGVLLTKGVTLDGLAVGASSQLDREHKQRITAGDLTRDRHYIWGKNGPVSGKPGVFHSW